MAAVAAACTAVGIGGAITDHLLVAVPSCSHEDSRAAAAPPDCTTHKPHMFIESRQ